MDKMQTYRVFSTVAEQLSFTKAAELLNLPRATVSTTVQSLEARLRVQLLNRTTRSVSLTMEGELFLEQCMKVLNDVDELEGIFQRSGRMLSGRIRIDMPVNFAREMVLPYLSEFRAQYPEILIDLSSTDDFIDVASESVDLVIRSGAYGQGNFTVKKLMDVRMGNYVSAHYKKQFGIPASLAELTQHSMISYARRLSTSEVDFVYEQAGKVHKTKVMSSLNVNNTVAYTDACLGGLGIAQLPTVAVQKYINSGDLIEILPDYRMPNGRIDLIYLRNKQLSGRVLAFIEWLEAKLSPQGTTLKT
ncbi:MAG: LysR family transcriptional regulator [Natronospirillum sp.]